MARQRITKKTPWWARFVGQAAASATAQGLFLLVEDQPVRHVAQSKGTARWVFFSVRTGKQVLIWHPETHNWDGAGKTGSVSSWGGAIRLAAQINQGDPLTPTSGAAV